MTPRTSFDTQTILLAEDNEDDIFIFGRAYKQARVRNPVQFARDGEEVVQYLAGAGRFADRAAFPVPHLLLLDLKLPLRNGLEVLSWIRERPDLAGLSVVVLTSSAEQRDLATARKLGARHYLVKPPRAKTLGELLAAFRAEWESGGVVRNVPSLEGDLFGVEAEKA